MKFSAPKFRPFRRLATIATLSLLTAATAAAQTQMPNMSRARRGPPQRNTVFQLSMQFTSGIAVSVEGEAFTYRFPDGPEAGGAIERFYGNGFNAVDFEGNLDNLTANWGFLSSDQVDLDNDTISFTTFGFENTDPISLDDNTDGMAVDLSLNRTLFRPTPNLWIGLTGGAQIGPIDAVGAFNTSTSLVEVTDTFSLNGFVPPTAPYLSGPTEDQFGNPFPAEKIGSIPLSRTITHSGTLSNIESRYDVSGGYYGFRLGAMIDFKVTDWLGLQLSAGASVILATAEFNYNETFYPPDGSNTAFTHRAAKTDDWLTGYYAEGSLQFWLNQRAGLFINGIMQKNGSLQMATLDHVATVDFENTSSIGFGVFYTF